MTELKRPLELLFLSKRGEVLETRHFKHPERALARAVTLLAEHKPGTVASCYDRSTGKFKFDIQVKVGNKLTTLYNTI